MKLNSENIILNYENINFKKNIFLISGNEETLIKKIEEVLILKLKKDGFFFVERRDDKVLDFKNHKKSILLCPIREFEGMLLSFLKARHNFKENKKLEKKKCYFVLEFLET